MWVSSCGSLGLLEVVGEVGEVLLVLVVGTFWKGDLVVDALEEVVEWREEVPSCKSKSSPLVGVLPEGGVWGNRGTRRVIVKAWVEAVQDIRYITGMCLFFFVGLLVLMGLRFTPSDNWVMELVPPSR